MQNDIPDLVTLQTDSTLGKLKRSALNAGRFLLKNGLPFVGAAVAGPAGLAVGAVAAGAIEYLDQPHLSRGQRLKSGAIKALKLSALAGGLGLTSAVWAPLGPALQAGAATLGTGAAGVLEYGTKTELDYEIDPAKFAQAFKTEAQTLLSEAGFEKAMDPVSSAGFSVGAEPRRLRAQVQIVKTAAILNHHLGAGVAVALAGQIGREGVDEQQLSQLKPRPFEDATESVASIEGVEVQRVKDLKSVAMAIFDKVYLDSEFEPDTGEAKSDFVTGHEISHVKNKDSSAELGQKALLNSLDGVRPFTTSQSSRVMLNNLENDLRAAHLEESRQDEFRADADGYEHAKQRGHSHHEILQGAEEIVGREQDENLYQDHPAGGARLEALNQLNGDQE